VSKKTGPTDIAASVHQRLLNISREQGEVFQYLLTRFVNERWLYRLSCSGYADRFVLKGATLFAVWTNVPFRPTRDVDFLGFGDLSNEALTDSIAEICSVSVVSDGLVFDVNSIRIEEITEAQEYPGRRVKLVARLGKARVTMQIDIGIGDVVSPEIQDIELPTILALPAPRIKGYPTESVVSEKLQAIVKLGMANSRMKDYYDLWQLSKTFKFEGIPLVQAITATFQQRQTEIPGAVPLGLEDEFFREHTTQWSAFLNKLPSDNILKDFNIIAEDIRAFLLPPLLAAAEDRIFEKYWSPGGSWS